MAIKNWEKFSKEFKKTISNEKIARFRKIKFLILIVLIILMIYFLKTGTINLLIATTIFAFVIITYLSFYLFIFAKAVEKTAMIKAIPPEEITEGDWIVDNIIVDKKKIVGPKDLGIEKKQIKELIALKQQGKINKIKVKYGLPFVPSFLIAYVLSLAFGAWWILLF